MVSLNTTQCWRYPFRVSFRGLRVWLEVQDRPPPSLPPILSPHWALLQQGCQGWTQTHRKIRRWSLSSGMVVRLSWGGEESAGASGPCAQP